MHNRTVTRGAQLVLLSFAIGLGLAIAYLVRSALLVIYVRGVCGGSDSSRKCCAPNMILGWKPSRGAAILIILAGIVTALALLFIFAIPPIISDWEILVHNYPKDSRIYVAE